MEEKERERKKERERERESDERNMSVSISFIYISDQVRQTISMILFVRKETYGQSYDQEKAWGRLMPPFLWLL